MSPTPNPKSDDPPTALLAILDTFRRHPAAVSERARESLEAFGLIDSTEAAPARSKHRR